MLLVCLSPISAPAQQTRSWFPNAADPQYEGTYHAYQQQMGARPVVAPALGYEASSSKGTSSPTQAPTHSAGQGGLTGVFSSVGDSIKQGFHKLGDWLTPKEKIEKAPEPTSVYNQARPSPDTYVAMARLCTESGRLAEAEQHYLQALQANPKHLGALLDYAKFKETQGYPAEAIPIYQRAMALYPQEPAVFNNAGLCYARNGQLETAAAALNRAVQLQPKKPLYRNNLAMVLVEMGRADVALAHLRSVYPEAVARFNLGQLLLHKGQWEAAAEQFTAALEADPSMQAAQAWLDQLAHRGVPSTSANPSRVARTPQRPLSARSEGSSWSEVTDLHPPAFSNPGESPEPQARLQNPRVFSTPEEPPRASRTSPFSPNVPFPEEDIAPLPPVEHTAPDSNPAQR